MTFPNLADIVQCKRISVKVKEAVKEYQLCLNTLTLFEIFALLGRFLQAVLSVCAEKGTALYCGLED